MTKAGSALLIFIKNPEKGKVKTRLAQSMGEERALSIYRTLLDHTWRVARSVDVERLLFYSNHIDLKDKWSARDFRKLVQHGEDLGERMLNAFRIALQDHERAVIIGSDCASLTPAIVEEAFRALNRNDFVIGPATDGGYYLLGMRKLTPSLFENIPWSTGKVFSSTMQRIRTLGKTCYQLPELSDIDYEEDWEKFGGNLRV